RAEEANPPQTGAVEFFDSSIGFLDLSLKDCMVISLKNNLDVEIARLDPLIEDKDISVEKAAFDPVFEALGEIRKADDPLNTIFITGSAPGELSRDIKTVDTTVSMLTPIGATVSVEYNFERTFRSTRGGIFFNPAFTTFFEAKLTQPLLKEFGIFYTRSKIYMARNDRRKSLHAFKRTAVEVANDVKDAYWDLVGAIEGLKVAHKSLQRAQELLENNRLQVRAGILAPIDVVAAEAEVASREEAIIIAENEVGDREDTLKRLMNFLRSDGDPWLAEITITPIDRPVFEVKHVDLNESIRIALENRPELFERKLELDNAHIEARRKKNELLPKLDLEGGVRYSGLDNSWNDTTENALTANFQEEFAKLTLEVPIGLRKERAEYSKAKFERRKAQLELGKQEQDILVEVREAVRQVKTDAERVKSTRKSLKHAQDRLDAEEKKFAVGRSTNLEILRAQEDLVEAEVREIRAIMEYQRALGGLEAVKGTILEQYDVVVEGQALENALIY
ncbi:MAG: TolC family protein, partial [Candidatus Brocadiales bacterium]